MRPRTTVTTTPSAANGAATAAFTRYRATITSLKVASNRRSAKLTLSCPAAAPKGCVVKLKGAISGRKAFAAKQIVMLRNTRKTLTMKLTSASSKRLTKKGGSLKASAATSFSTLAPASKTVKVTRKR